MSSSQHKTSQSFEAGFTMKRNATRDFNYLQRVREIIEWIDLCAHTHAAQRLEQYGEEVFLGFFNIIRDGVLLCQAINGARPGTISKIYTDGTIQAGRRYTFKAMQNIQFFLHAGLKLGATVLPFSPMDLFERTNEFNMLDFIWNVKEVVELAPGEFLLGQGPGSRGRGKGSVKMKAPINLPSLNEAHEKEEQEEREKHNKNAVVSLRSQKKKSGHAALDMNIFASPDGTTESLEASVSPRGTPVTSPSHSHPSPSTSPPAGAVSPPPDAHSDDELDLKIEVEAEEKLKKAHEEAARILPVLYVDGNAEEQDPGITLADIRVTYPGCYLREFQGSAVFRNGGFVLANGKGYELIRPAAHDKLTEEEAADVKTNHHDDHDHDEHDHLYDDAHEHDAHDSHDSPTQSPPQSPSASPIVSPAPSHSTIVSSTTTTAHNTSSSSSVVSVTHSHNVPTSSSAPVPVDAAHAIANAHATHPPTTNHQLTAPATVAGAAATTTAASHSRSSSPARTATSSSPPKSSPTDVPATATVGHAPAPHKDASTHADGSHSLTSVLSPPAPRPEKDGKLQEDTHDEHDEEDEHSTSLQMADDAARIALSALEEQYDAHGKKLSLRMKRQAGMGKTKIILKGSVRAPGKSVVDDSPQGSPDMNHGSLKKQPSSPALQAGKLSSRVKGGVSFQDGSPSMTSATLGSRKPNYAYDIKPNKKRQQVIRSKKRVEGKASWEANEILPGLWLGDKCDSMERTAMKQKGITNVFTVACDLPPPFPNDFEYKVLDLLDSSSQNIIQYFPDAIRYIEANVANGRQTLVHCQQGVSRSATVVIAYVMYQQRMDFDSAGEHVCSRRNRVCPNFGFMQQLKQWGETLQREWAAESLAKAQGLPVPPSLIYSTTPLVPETLTLNVPFVASSTSASVSTSTAPAVSVSVHSPPPSPTHSSASANSLSSMFITPKHSEHSSSSASSTSSLKHLDSNHSGDEAGGGMQVHVTPPVDTHADKAVSVS